MYNDFRHLSRLTHKAALKVWDYAEKYNLSIRGGFSYPDRGDSLYFMINEPGILAFIHCTPYCYLVNSLIGSEGEEEELFFIVRNIRSFMSRIRRLADGDESALYSENMTER